MGSLTWQERAACSGDDMDRYFDDVSLVTGEARMHTRYRRWKAKQACHHCPVVRQCLEYAQRVGADFGVFGGMDQLERTMLRWNERGQRRRFPAVGLSMLIRRMRVDGYRWHEIADTLGITLDKAYNLYAEPPKATSGQHYAQMREYAAWRDVAEGHAPTRIASVYEMSIDHASLMCKTMDADPEYTGPRGKERSGQGYAGSDRCLADAGGAATPGHLPGGEQ